MENKKLYMVMVGLPARGKSTIALKLKDNLSKDKIKVRIFNNGDIRRRTIKGDTAYARFYDPNNREALQIRENIALTNMKLAQRYLNGKGQVAILDATNTTLRRRKRIQETLTDHPILFIECIHNDEEILNGSIMRKISKPEFSHLTPLEAFKSFKERITHYIPSYSPLKREKYFIQLDSLNNQIIHEEVADEIPFFDRIRDFLVTDSVKNLYLIRHGETYFNLENRIGGDSELTDRGAQQARDLAAYFQRMKIPLIFTSKKKRTIQTAEPICRSQPECSIIPLTEFNEINSGICECMSYEEIKANLPEVYYARKQDKHNYVYPEGEGYKTMRERIDRGIKKALYLSNLSGNIMIIGHRAVNRMILSHFLYRRQEDVPYIYIPQDKFYYISATQNKKVFQLRSFQ
jgi:broad specificity phosphatase PhoE